MLIYPATIWNPASKKHLSKTAHPHFAKLIVFWSGYRRKAIFYVVCNKLFRFCYRCRSMCTACMCGESWCPRTLPANIHCINIVDTFYSLPWLVDSDTHAAFLTGQDQRLLEQTGSKYNPISNPISMAHIISCGHTYCSTLMSFTMTAYVFILLTQSVGNEQPWLNLQPAVMCVCTVQLSHVRVKLYPAVTHST